MKLMLLIALVVSMLLLSGCDNDDLLNQRSRVPKPNVVWRI